ncbi:hypothetical protein [Pseudomonas aeruginosa]|uniref:hypothetical protein n=1 Tax=Pseudomonas aeruginosa TaxID=287 RepID=UPI000AB3C738|nr:hypothetical protein [Pseudomonas aeruginosa]HCK0588809.1 hypothetical protein [Pseudomonas aeruginosa]
MSSTQHQLIEQCATRLRGIVEALDNIHDNTPHRWSTELDDVHSSAESLLALIKDQAPTQAAQDLALRTIAEYPCPEQDNMTAANMRQVAADAITGALAFGAQASRPPPADHWLRPFYDIGRAEGQRTQELAMLVRMLASSLKRHAPESNLVARATNYLAAKGLADAALAQPSPAQAEAERPEVVGVRYEDGTILSAEDCGIALEVCAKVQTPLMTVAQHERIVEARWNRAMDLLLDHVSRISEKFKAERDAALARVAELERQEPVALANRGLHAFWVKWTEAAAGLYGPGIKLYAAPVAQAQHSVPEGWMLVECGIWTQEQVDEMQKTVARFRNSELVDDRALAMAVADAGQCKAPEISLAELLAAAPGKEVPQAWIDVQAERRRQIEAEGWTPEHDDGHACDEIAAFACYYAMPPAVREWDASSTGYGDTLGEAVLPEGWEPKTGDRRRDLIKACALALAEIERLDRAGISQSPQPGATTASS